MNELRLWLFAGTGGVVVTAACSTGSFLLGLGFSSVAVAILFLFRR